MIRYDSNKKIDHLDVIFQQGKEWTTPTGEVINFNPMFVKKISTSGQVSLLGISS
jgi:hypothetical protein